MITIPESTPPKGSYETLIKSPLTKRIVTQIISELSIEDFQKEQILSEVSSIIENFKDFSYTGDIENFKINLYTALSEIPNDATLLDIISTEEFIAKTTKKIENDIFIGLEDGSKVSLVEYINTIRKRENKDNILPVLRGLHSFDKDLEISRDTTELLAAIKKHIVIKYNDESSQNFSSLVEQKKEKILKMREDESHYHNIEYYTNEIKISKNRTKKEFKDMFDQIMEALSYFSNSNGYKKEKLDRLMNEFIRNLARSGLSSFQQEFYNNSIDLFNVKFKRGLNIEQFKILINHNKEYKILTLDILLEKQKYFLKTQQILQERIKNFFRPSREERCNKVPPGYPIKSDQEYQRELRNLKLELGMYEKNFALFESYIEKLKNMGLDKDKLYSENTNHNNTYNEIDDMSPEEKLRP